MALALTGDTLSAKEAEKWGLIWKCFSDETLMKFAEDLPEGLRLVQRRHLLTPSFLCKRHRFPV